MLLTILSRPPTSQEVMLTFLYSIVSTLKPIVGIVVTTSPSFRRYSIVVLPAASSPVEDKQHDVNGMGKFSTEILTQILNSLFGYGPTRISKWDHIPKRNLYNEAAGKLSILTQILPLLFRSEMSYRICWNYCGKSSVYKTITIT